MKYSESHEWVRLDGSIATIGVTDYAQKELGEIVYVELPIKGHAIKAGEDAVVLESTKAAVDIYSPVTGEIVEVNDHLRNMPEIVNSSSENEGWIFKVKMKNAEELDTLMDSTAYQNYIKNL